MATFVSATPDPACLLGTSMHLSASGPSASEDGSRGDGDNLVGPFLPTASARPALLVNWPKSAVSRAVFQGYTASGTSAPLPWNLSGHRGSDTSLPLPPFLLGLLLGLETDWGSRRLFSCARPSVATGLQVSPPFAK